MRRRISLPDGEASRDAVTPFDGISALVRKVGTRKNSLKQFDNMCFITPSQRIDNVVHRSSQDARTLLRAGQLPKHLPKFFRMLVIERQKPSHNLKTDGRNGITQYFSGLFKKKAIHAALDRKSTRLNSSHL